MDLTPTEQTLKNEIKEYAEENGWAINPDEECVDRVVKGLVMLKEKKGEKYCPCRLTSGDAEKDAAIICPCKFHEEEITKDGMCHCRLLVSKEYAEANG